MKHLFRFIIALCLLFSLSFAASTASSEEPDEVRSYDSDGNYLCGSVDLLLSVIDEEDEEEDNFDIFDRIEIPKNESGRYAISPDKLVPRYSDRKMTRSMKIATDRVVETRVSILVPQGKTLTVEKGATLRVRGRIRVEGELVNNGTILIDGQRDIIGEVYSVHTSHERIGYYYRRSSERVAVDGEAIHLTAYGRITNSGTLTNRGNLRIAGGFVENDRGGMLQNDGVLTIDNGKHQLHGIYNTTRGGNSKATIVRNNGTLEIVGPPGFGIEGNKGSSTENAGTITVSNDAVAGKVTGNAVKRREE